MSSWMNDAAAVQSHNGAAFNHLSDPNSGPNMLDPSAFMTNPNAFDASQFQNQQLQQRMQNGAMRNSSPGFNNPIYQTSSVVPSKRPRPREDSLGTSPRQTSGMLPNSRSQTPQQGPYQGFPSNNQLPQHGSQQTPTPYSHLQHNGSANASPSPIMANQLRPGAVPQRVSTASPHPFSPAVQQFAGQGSPSQSDNGSRVDTPQNPYMQNPGFAPGFNQNFTPPPGRTSAPPQGPMVNPQMSQMGHPQMQQPQMYQQQQQQQRPTNLEQQKMMYQMRLQQQLQQSNLMAAQRMQSMPQNHNPLARQQQMQAANGQFPPGMRPQQPVSRPNNPEQFMKHLTTFMQSRGLSLDLNPIVGERTINLVVLYMAVQKFGGYKRVNQQNVWPQVAQALQFNPMQIQSAPQQIKGHYERNLMMFEEAYNTQQQRQKAMMQQNAAANLGTGHPQMSPTKPMNPQNQMQPSQQFIQQQQQQQQGHMIQQQHQLQSLHGPNTPVKQMNPMNALQQPNINGFSSPQTAQTPNQHQATAQAHARNALSRNIDASATQNGTFALPSAASAKRSNLASQSSHPDPSTQADPGQSPTDFEMDKVYDPAIRILNTWGGVAFSDEINHLVETLVYHKPNVPTIGELGVIDIHALNMSLQSGIHAEVRLALDTLATLSMDRLELRSCEDLVETIIDCAEVQVELLAENAAEVSDVMLISSYEDVVRGARIERDGLQEIPAFATLEYDLDRSVERLICITTVMRNLSFYDPNQAVLADELVIKFLCIVIRYLGTRNMLLRTYGNTLDFMKDVIIILSNLAHTIEIPGREQALCLLHFLLAFAPCPPPNVGDKVIFSPYDPAVHRYSPFAVDSLAKLLARDEPNRTFYKGIFASDVASSPPFDLLTKAFALAISPIPGHGKDEQRGYMKVVEARKPHLMQGMLAAEILSNLLPGYESNIAKSWLTSEDGFAQSLLRLVTKLSLEAPAPAPPRGPPVPHRDRGGDDEALLHITLSGITVLRRLMEKSQHPDDSNLALPNDGMIKKELLLGALLMKQPAQPRSEVIKQLCLYASLDS